jgi:hypothetical protein
MYKGNIMKLPLGTISTISALFLSATIGMADENTPEPPRFLDDKQITCTGEASVPAYNGPCGTNIG